MLIFKALYSQGLLHLKDCLSLYELPQVVRASSETLCVYRRGLEGGNERTGFFCICSTPRKSSSQRGSPATTYVIVSVPGKDFSLADGILETPVILCFYSDLCSYP